MVISKMNDVGIGENVSKVRRNLRCGTQRRQKLRFVQSASPECRAPLMLDLERTHSIQSRAPNFIVERCRLVTRCPMSGALEYPLIEEYLAAQIERR